VDYYTFLPAHPHKLLLRLIREPFCYQPHVAHTLKISIDEAATFLGMYFSGTGDEKIAKKIEKALLEGREEWNNNFQKRLSILSEGVFLPHLIFLVAHPDYSSEIKKILQNFMLEHEETTASSNLSIVDTPARPHKTEALRTSELMQESLIVNTLTPKTLSHFVHFSEMVPGDVFLAIDALFVDKLHHLKS